MTISANAYMRTSSNSDYTSPIVWSEESEKYIYEQSVFQPFAVDITPVVLNKPGRQYNYDLDSAFSSGLLTEGIATPVSALTYTQVSVTFNAYGDAKQITDEKLEESFSFVLDGIKYGALGSMSENRESVIVTELLTTTSTGIYSNGKTSSTISSSDTFNTQMIANVKTAMMQTQARTCRAIVVHPMQYNSMIKLPNFVNAAQYGDKRVIMTGEIGDYLGIRILVSNHITTATENSITVYKAIALGLRPYLFGIKRNFEFNFERERLRDRAVTASWWEMIGVQILKDNSIIVMTSSGGY